MEKNREDRLLELSTDLLGLPTREMSKRLSEMSDQELYECLSFDSPYEFLKRVLLHVDRDRLDAVLSGDLTEVERARINHAMGEHDIAVELVKAVVEAKQLLQSSQSVEGDELAKLIASEKSSDANYKLGVFLHEMGYLDLSIWPLRFAKMNGERPSAYYAYACMLLDKEDIFGAFDYALRSEECEVDGAEELVAMIAHNFISNSPFLLLLCDQKEDFVDRSKMLLECLKFAQLAKKYDLEEEAGVLIGQIGNRLFSNTQSIFDSAVQEEDSEKKKVLLNNALVDVKIVKELDIEGAEDLFSSIVEHFFI